MATPGTTGRIRKRLRQRFGVSAPKLAIRTHVAWYWWGLALLVVLGLSLAVGAWLFDAGRRVGGLANDESAREIQALRDHVMELDAELTKLRSLVGVGESSLQIERATRLQVSRQARILEVENAELKEDLAFFEGLVPASDSGEELGVRIDKLRIMPGGGTGEYRYRMLVINGGGRQAKDLKGELQLVVKVWRDGKDAMITLPSSSEPHPQRYGFEVRRYHRLEGGFAVPEGDVVKEVEARVLQDGVVRAWQSARM